MKKIGILGTGVVGETIGSKLIELGYEVKMGSRTVTNEKAIKWKDGNGSKASNGTFADAANFGEIIFLCTKGEITLDALKMAGIENFNGKTVIDISNPLDFLKGMPPSLIPEFCNIYSLGEAVQELLVGSNVVKTLNIVNAHIMVDAKLCGGDATMLVSGNDGNAKTEAKAILNQFGWNDIIDLGDITTARGTEQLLPVWVRIWQATGNGYFAFKIVGNFEK